MPRKIREEKNVFVWGAFDILHPGHIKFLEEASRLGDLYAIIIPDEVVKRWKKIVFDEGTRRKNLLNTGFVKEVFIDALPEMNCLNKVNPDIFCFGYDQVEEWKEKLRSHVLQRFPACEFVTLEKYGDVHSSDLRGTIDCPCGSGRMWKDCHGK